MPGKPPRAKPPSQRRNCREPARPGHYDANDERFIAWHEAGHAVSAVVLGMGLESVDILRRRLPDGRLSLGFTKTRPLGFLEIIGKGEDVARPHLGQRITGTLAEAVLNPLAVDSVGSAPDFDSARRIAEVAICRAKDLGGGNMTIEPDEIRRNADRLGRLYGSAYEDANRLVRGHLGAVFRVAKLLRERKRLSGAEVTAVVNDPRVMPTRSPRV